jgi:hypothetical protein
MTRIQRLAGIFKFGEKDDFDKWYDDATNHFKSYDNYIETTEELGKDLAGVVHEHHGYGFRQIWTVELLAAVELPLGTLLDASGANDGVTTCGALSTAVVGVAAENPHPVGVPGAVCTVPGSVVDIRLIAAGVAGQYVETSAVAGQGQCNPAPPAAKRCVGICIETTGGPGLARCVYYRM